MSPTPKQGRGTRAAARLAVAALGACMALSLAAALPTAGKLLLGEFRLGVFLRPKTLTELLPPGVESPRFRRIYRICKRNPAGTIGMAYYTYARLAQAERATGNIHAYFGIETIQREFGQPLRFDKKRPASVKFELIFVDAEPPARDELLRRLRAEEVFEDMALIPVEAQP